MKLGSVLGVILFLFVTPAALAEGGGGGGGGLMISENAFFWNSTKDDQVNNTKTNSLNNIYDGKVGYLTSSGIYLGGIYTSRSDNTGNTNQRGSSGGGSLGYFRRQDGTA